VSLSCTLEPADLGERWLEVTEKKKAWPNSFEPRLTKSELGLRTGKEKEEKTDRPERGRFRSATSSQRPHQGQVSLVLTPAPEKMGRPKREGQSEISSYRIFGRGVETYQRSSAAGGEVAHDQNLLTSRHRNAKGAFSVLVIQRWGENIEGGGGDYSTNQGESRGGEKP